ncbi:LacI family transcriptional regulator [Bifidobacterium lemurum]|uniref:LacI family transcriptional regulator n=1 Tax=Bifidobacterium lemurum TaxID=1603886 RepID=A0A261FQ46_9BIFI|nr:LacI family DNA-binding transcriptional regulator [Bifidobacterium lemurum]OZG61312.1 LacI family transcriptional regulator [Bifidobacterium lemurum]QOL34700.1 LacI family DNA-binding transcriptional regulator [Bifidobacterium lemurum]
MRRATVYDVANKAGVSTATVSFTFRHPEKVKPSTREKVLGAAHELEYVPSASARGLARGRTGVLGLYSFDMLLERTEGIELAEDDAENAYTNAGSDIMDPDVRAYPLYVDEVQRGFELECWRRGRVLQLSTAAGHGAEESIAEIAGRVDGLALFPSEYVKGLPLERLCRQMPVVRISAGSENVPAAYVNCDNTTGMNAIVDHLIDVHHVRSVAFVGVQDSSDMRERYAAFVRRIRERGLGDMPALVDDSRAVSAEWFVKLCDALGSGQLPEAVVCSNDQSALGVVELLQDAGLKVPDDVIVTGFDGVLAGRLLHPTLTTVRQPMEAMGRLAAKLLDEQAEDPWREPCEYRLPVRFIARESCGCA